MKESPMKTSTSPRELHHRVADGIHVSLLWYPETNRVTVDVFDEALGESFEFEVPSARALDAFHHPFAYAAFDDVVYATRTRERVGA
jgi:hypothetical protein